MNIKKFLVIFILGGALAGNGQTSNDKMTASSDSGIEFMYKGKPISPEALIPFFPHPDASSSQTVVYLDRALMYWVSADTIRSSGIKGLEPGQAKRAYTCFTDDGFVSYIVLHKTAPDRFVILACLDIGEPVIQFYTFAVDVKGNKLIKTGGIKTVNIKEYPIDLKNNNLVYHDNSYMIPAVR
jgi:hypothetical protein